MTAKRTPFAYPGDITIDTLPELLAFHRATFGGFRMGDDADKDKGSAGSDGDKDKDKGSEGYKPPASQADLDRIISDRLAREREKFADYSDLKTKAAAHDQALEDAMSEADKKIAAAKREGETEAITKANTRIVSSEARALAAEAKFRNPALAVQAINLSGVKVGDDGEVDSAALKALLKDLAESDPYLVDDGKKQLPKADHSQGGGGTDEKPGVDRGREMFAARRARKTA